MRYAHPITGKNTLQTTTWFKLNVIIKNEDKFGNGEKYFYFEGSAHRSVALNFNVRLKHGAVQHRTKRFCC